MSSTIINEHPLEKQPANIPIITWPLPKLLDYIFTYVGTRGNSLERIAVIDIEDARYIKQLDPLEEYVHIEIDSSRPKVGTLFRTKDWKESAERVYKLRTQRIKLVEANDTIFSKIKASSLGSLMDDMLVNKIARKIIDTKNNDIAKQYGVDLSEFIL